MTEKQNKDKDKEIPKPDFELLTHKYSDFYDGFYLYDVQSVDYPCYRTKIVYDYSKAQEIHPVIIAVLKTIQFLESVRDLDVYTALKNITQLDKDILDSILAEMTAKGYLKQADLKLSTNGKEILQKAKEVVTDTKSAYLHFDGIFGAALPNTEKPNKDQAKSRKGAIEFKPYVKSRPRIESLDEEFSDSKTLRQVIIENLQNEEEDVTRIREVWPNKFFNQYICLFYKDRDENEKLLALDHNYGIDAAATGLFDKLISEQKFTIENSPFYSRPLFAENEKKFKDAKPEIIEKKVKPIQNLDITDGKTIEVDEHKKYFMYALENARRNIYIQSPWINWRTLQIYKDAIQNAVGRGVKVTIKYGMKARNRHDNPDIDDSSKHFFKNLDNKYFSLMHTYDHSKILICDTDFMIVGSFNWLSFGGGDEKGARGETSSINKNKDAIDTQIEKFSVPQNGTGA